MDWKEANDERQARTRIVEMLVALAFLADCACSRSDFVRRLILWILKPAEAFVRNFVIVESRTAGCAITALPVPMSAGDSVADAMRLAACFRALAVAVQQLPLQLGRFARWMTSRHRPIRHPARNVLNMSSRPALAPSRPFDTS